MAALAWSAAATGSVVGADQATKIASSRLDAVPGITPLSNPASGLAIVDAGRWPEAGLMALGILLAACWLVPRVADRRDGLGAALLLGGATGNLVDRLVLGGVRDFLPIGPVVVNLADLAVVAGLALWLLARHRGRAARPRSRRTPVTRREGGEQPC